VQSSKIFCIEMLYQICKAILYPLYLPPMFKVQSKKANYQVAFNKKELFAGNLNDIPFEGDLVHIANQTFHLIFNHKSYTVEILEVESESKNISIKLNGNVYSFSVKDRFDLLLEQMGMSANAGAKLAELKAPMPGLVLTIAVEIGQEVKKGDSLLVLEAMKMENVIKSPADVKIKSIAISKGQAVEKNQLLISFE
jgi:biotin carboxyl carrier protein